MARHDTGSTLSEHELVARCKRGDRDAQRALYERTSGRVFRLLVRMTRSPQAAEDLAQETYLKVFSHIGRFDERAALHTWLYRIAVNEALQWLRRKRPSAMDPEVVATRPDPRTNGHEAGLRLDVEAGLAALEPEDRAILLLRYQEGLDYRAIAEVADLAKGTVASRLNRARARLRALLGDFASAGEETPPAPHRIQHGMQDAAGRGAPDPVRAHRGSSK